MATNLTFVGVSFIEKFVNALLFSGVTAVVQCHGSFGFNSVVMIIPFTLWRLLVVDQLRQNLGL